MRRPPLRFLWVTAALGCYAGAIAVLPPPLPAVREFASRLVRPLALPFVWSGLDEAIRSGNAGEAWARGRQIALLLPAWTDGQVVFAFRFALDGGTLVQAPAERAAAALTRLQVALAWLEDARAHAGRREVDLLQAMAFLPEVAVNAEPLLHGALRAQGGAAAIADRYLAEAERISGGAAVREQRTFLAPWLCAGLLDAGDRLRALAVLDLAIDRAAEVRDRETATEWAARLDEVRRHLRGEPGVDLAKVLADARFEPLHALLR